jgi:hypothetical protein
MYMHYHPRREHCNRLKRHLNRSSNSSQVVAPSQAACQRLPLPLAA